MLGVWGFLGRWFLSCGLLCIHDTRSLALGFRWRPSACCGCSSHVFKLLGFLDSAFGGCRTLRFLPGLVSPFVVLTRNLLFLWNLPRVGVDFVEFCLSVSFPSCWLSLLAKWQTTVCLQWSVLQFVGLVMIFVGLLRPVMWDFGADLDLLTCGFVLL